MSFSDQLAAEDDGRDRGWWQARLDALVAEVGGEAFHELPADHGRPALRSGRHALPIVERLEAGAVAELARVASARRVRLHVLFLTLLGAEARRRTGRSCVIVGADLSLHPPGSGGSAEPDGPAGRLADPVPLILTGRGAPALADQLRATQAGLDEAVEHGSRPPDELLRELRARHPDALPGSRASLFDLAFTTGHPLAGEPGPDLVFALEPSDGDEAGGLALSLAWNPDVFRRSTAEAWLRSLAGWARWLAEDPGRAEAPLPPLLPEEARLLARWEHGPARPRPALRFDRLFERVADAHPDRPAVVTEAGVQSYAELERQANQIARCLLDHGVAREEPVAVLTECSALLPATVLGVWKAGAAYLPLALEQPPDRLVHLARDGGARTLVVLDGHAVPPALAGAVGTILRPEDWQASPALRPEVSGAPGDLAFVIYTSGTSGKPKGVLLQHDSLVNVALTTGETCGLGPEDRVSLIATPGFDASLWELGLALLHGMAIVPVSRALRDDPWAMKRWYKAHGVTVAFHTPSYLRVSQQVPFEGMRVLITGGEAPSHEDARRHAGGLALWNGYGPTETCIFVCAELLSAQPDVDRPLSVGTPNPNTCVSIRRDSGVPVPPGVLGEVWLGGVGLARGYLNSPELTRQRFVETPEGRFYRSGDLGLWTEDGRLELAGRIDDQIKLHGQRVELGEIEQALRAHPAVEEALVLVDAAAEGTKVLRAFVRLHTGAAAPADEAWRAHLDERLPVHMIPASVTAVAAIPLTVNGKVDREVLLSASRARSSEAPRTPPRGALEERVAAVWEDLLKTARADPPGAEPRPETGGIFREDNFFALGGNSLLAVTLAHRLSRELGRQVPARLLFAAPTLAGFARRLAARGDPAVAQGVPAAAPARSELATEGQREFRVAEAAGLDTRTFNMTLLLAVEGGSPSPESWREAWAALVARHEALRTSFQEDAGAEARLRRIVAPIATPALELTARPDLASARAFVRSRQAEPFDMGAPPLWRAGLVDVADTGERLFWLALHHALGDGRSLGILVEELGALLRGAPLPPLTGHFGESARREEEYLAGPACAADARYWRELLDRLPDEAFAEGPLEFARSVTASPGSHRFEARLDAAVAQRLRTLARQHETGLHAVMLTLLALEARRRLSREDVLLGATASTRETVGEAEVVGYYVNMLPVVFQLPRGISFGEALRGTQQTLAAGLQHARYPFARIYHDLWRERAVERHPLRYPLFDLAVTENPGWRPSAAHPRLAPLPAPAYERSGTSPGEDMVLAHEDLPDGGLLLQWQVNAALFGEETARAWFDALRSWAEWLVQEPARVQEALPALLPAEAASLSAWEEGTQVARPALRFHELFERVLERPGQRDRPAVVTPAGTVTYGALEQEANALAHGLLQRGAVAGDVVGVLTGRSARLPAVVLGIWKAGGTYLPLSADLPEHRLAFLARDAGMTHLVALDGLPVPPALPPALRPEELDAGFLRTHDHRPPPPAGAGAAYVIYTSGSTGEPKGTRIGHAAYVNSVLGTGETLGLTPEDRSLLFASPSFDVSLSDVGLPLAFGASLCPVPADVASSPRRFRELLTALRVTVADVTPTYLRLLDGFRPPALRILVTGGEAPFSADVDAYAGRLRYFNAYGPTENTITSTLGALRPGRQGTLPAGRPLPNTSVHVCDAAGDPVPPGVAGELWLGGAGLADGYVDRPALTAAAFLDTARGRRYRTGDLGRWGATGELEILGRIDDQVKLNGVRIELGEIEHALSRHPDVAQAVALLDGDAAGHQSLWAFVRPRPGREPRAEEGWREYLASRLPRHLVPSAVIAVDDIPLSSAGKVDRAALKRRLADRAARGEGAEPEAGLEAEIARVWSELLGVPRIHRDDDFFSLGGHSLLAIAVAHRLEQALGRPVPARELFAEPTLRGFARRVSRPSDEDAGEDVSSDRATEGQREFWIAGQAGLDTRGFNVALTLARRGQDRPDARWRAAWAALVARHEALRTGFHEGADGVLRRSVLPALDAPLELAALPDMDLASALVHVRERQTDALAMDRPPLWRAGLVRVGATGRPVFWLVVHHSVADGVSLGVLAEELSTLLDRGPLDGTLPPVASRFDRSAGREGRYLAGPACQADALYWRAALDGLGASAAAGTSRPFDDWPLDLPRPLGRTARNARGAHVFRVQLDAPTTSGLRKLAQQCGASLHALMLTILAQEVRRRTGRPEFVLGTAASIRDSAAEARIVGYYVNVLPLPCRVDRGESVEQALRRMQRTLAEGLQHARYPFARICADLRQRNAVAPHPARHPLIDLAVTESPDPAVAGFGAVDRGAGYELRMNAPAQDMLLVHEGQADGGLCLQWYVDASIYERETAEAWIDSLAGWARFLGGAGRLAGSPLPALLPEEERALTGWEHGPAVPAPAPSFPAWFERWARSHPDRLALVTEHRTRTYAEVDAGANALAHALLDRGVAREEVVGVLTDRSTALPETVLAIWKAGACYLPLVAELPAERMAFIARDAGIRLLVVLDGREVPAPLASTCQVFRPESLSEAYRASHGHPVDPGGDGVRGSALAYVIYTSGSTGEPKGVLLRHEGLTNLALGITRALGMGQDDRAAIMASPSFDAWISEVVMAWAVGGAVVPVLREELDDPGELRAKLERLGVTVATMPPSYLRLLGQADLPSLRVLVTAGEPPHRADAIHYASRLRYVNGYGPTENTVAVGFGWITAGAQRLATGSPLPNTSVHLRDGDGVPVPPGAGGMVWLGGAQLAAGYLNRPELTAASFVETPEGRRYRTGDLGRWTRSGELEILGRSDDQAKLRGQRIELGEIEQRLGAHPAVRQAVAVVETRPGGAQALWAFACILPGAAPPTQAAWREHLSATLPSYMVPQAVIGVAVIPVTQAGKVDRAALLRSAAERGELAANRGDPEGTPPREGLEQQIAQVWAEHLELSSVHREDSFFDLGGDSLRAIAVVHHLRRTLQCTVNALYEHPRLAEFAATCRQRPEHLRAVIRSARRHWEDYRRGLPAYEAERDEALAAARRGYEARNEPYRRLGAGRRRDYGAVLLTGATGYLGSYVLRELLGSRDRRVSVLVRSDGDRSARVHLGKTLCHYFGPEQGAALRDHPRLEVLAGDLRRDDLGLASLARDRLADDLEAIFHCAANVKHYGHPWEFHADNVAATARLLALAAHRSAHPADFHLVSTLSVRGKAPEKGFQLFTEYDPVPTAPDDNFYVHSKQEAERRVVAARRQLANACIHRVGNLVFAAEGGALQYDLRDNAFFRQIAAFLRLGVVPDDAHVWLCHVDLVARGLVLLAEDAELTHETHHLEAARRDTLAEFVAAAGSVRGCRYDAFLERLEEVVEEPALNRALTETLENYELYDGRSPQARSRRMEVVTDRSQLLLARAGVVWPPLPAAGQRELLRQAAAFFALEAQEAERRAGPGPQEERR